MEKINWKGYIGKLTICGLVTFFGGNALSTLITHLLPTNLINTDIVKPLPWIIINVIVLILSDVFIYISDKTDSITYWKKQYNNLERDYQDLKNIHKKLLFKSIDSSDIFYQTDFTDFFHSIKEATNKSTKHLDEVDIELLKHKCDKYEQIITNSSTMKKLAQSTNHKRNSINGSLKKQ